MTLAPCRLPGVRDQLGKVGGVLMGIAAAAALGYLITSRAVAEPSPPLKWPVWPYYLCARSSSWGPCYTRRVTGECRGAAAQP